MSRIPAEKRKCDICGRKVDRWDISSVKKIQKYPGKIFDKCSSDVKTNTTNLANLCPTCMEKLEKLIYKHINK